jgi:hypothetical protein
MRVTRPRQAGSNVIVLVHNGGVRLESLSWSDPCRWSSRFAALADLLAPRF